jgi:hypothetical protein
MALPNHINDREYEKFRDTGTQGQTRVAIKIEESIALPITFDPSIYSSILSAEDKEEEVTYLNINSRKNRRPNTITYTAVSVSPTASVVDTFAYTLAAGEYVYTGTTRVTTP